MNLLENYNELPEAVQDVLFSYNEEADNLYQECERVAKELAEHGYTIEYDLSGEFTHLEKDTQI